MFTKKLEDQFSADLLNTVRGVLDEAKKCPEDCECEKCEKEDDEDEDEGENGKEKMKEGYVSAAQRKAVWANRADDGKGHPDKKKKMKEEGYVPTADEPTDANKKTADKVRALLAKEKKPVKEEIDADLEAELKATRQTTKSIRGHSRGAMGRAVMKKERNLAQARMDRAARAEMKKEEVEQVDEVSKATLGRYINKAKDSIDMASYRQGHKEAHGSSSKPLEKKLTKRHKGISTAVKKLTKEDAEQIDELSKDTMGRYINKAATKMGSQGVTAGLKIAADEKSSKNFKDMGKREKGIKLAVSKLTKEEQDFIDALNDTDLEQIDELSKKTLGSYVNKASTDMYYKGQDTQYHANKANKADGVFAKQSREKHRGEEEKANRKASNRSTGIERAVNKLTKENVDLEEGRGRPPKEGSAAWKARQKQADDDMVALGMQLRKAKSINKKVRFMDNKEHDIHPNHITRFDDHMAARRTTQEKDNFQRQAHKSHADFVKAVSAPVPKAAKDTGEIVKYR